MFYRRMMDKILDKWDEDTFVTNPDEPIRTFFRKLVFRWAVWRSKRGRWGRRRPSLDSTDDARR